MQIFCGFCVNVAAPRCLWGEFCAVVIHAMWTSMARVKWAFKVKSEVGIQIHLDVVNKRPKKLISKKEEGCF